MTVTDVVLFEIETVSNNEVTLPNKSPIMAIWTDLYWSHANIRGRVLRGWRLKVPCMHCRHGRYVMKQHCSTAFDVCGQAIMSRGVQAHVPRSSSLVCMRAKLAGVKHKS